MNYTVIDFFAKITTAYLLGNFYTGLINKKYESVTIVSSYLVMSYLYYYFVEPLLNTLGGFSSIARIIVVVGFHLVFPFIFSKDKTEKNIINCSIFMLVLAIYEFILGCMFYLLKGYIPTHEINDITTFVWNLIFNASFFLFSTIILIVIQLKRKKIQNKSVLLIIIMPFIQVLLMVVLFLINIDMVDSKLVFLGEVMLIFFILTDYLTYKIIKRNLDNYNLKKDLEMSQLKSEYNYLYYELATSKFDEIASIKHDINNQIQGIYALIDCSQHHLSFEKPDS